MVRVRSFKVLTREMEHSGLSVEAILQRTRESTDKGSGEVKRNQRERERERETEVRACQLQGYTRW